MIKDGINALPKNDANAIAAAITQLPVSVCVVVLAVCSMLVITLALISPPLTKDEDDEKKHQQVVQMIQSLNNRVDQVRVVSVV
jgi:hypothetical protein